MITSTKPSRSLRQSVTSGFTLVEILVVITIIGILAGVLIPAIANALGRAKIAAQRLEINALDQAVKAYEAKYGDYPPDGSNQAILKRHLQKIFPRMAPTELTLLDLLTDNSDTDTAGSLFSGVAMDRSEALVFFLGGFSNDIQHPISGPGGPIELKRLGDASKITHYQYNATRDNAFFDFDPARLMIGRVTELDPLMSTDESLLGLVDGPHGGIDPFPAYQAIAGDDAPIVYFDSRTYGVIATVSGVNTYNGYLASSVGAVRPYKSDQGIKPPSGATYGIEQAAFDAVAFQNPNTFQIISPGSDLFFGKLVSNSGGTLPVHFTAAGVPYIPNDAATAPSELIFPNVVANTKVGSKGFQDSEWVTSTVADENINGNLDNVTNFTESTLGNGLE